MTIVLFLKEFWHWVVIAILAISIMFLGYKLDAKDSEITQVKLEHKKFTLNLKI